MALVIEFRSTAFDVSREPENPVNPIFGHSLLTWLGPQLATTGIEVPAPDYEDWGWYVDVSAFGASYLVGASAEVEESASAEPVAWVVQIEKQRSLWERIRGHNQLATDDPLCVRVLELLRSEASTKDLEAYPAT
ncbi:MAG: hypothetical protein AAF430_18150 [Myxococcota bacterium]